MNRFQRKRDVGGNVAPTVERAAGAHQDPLMSLRSVIKTFGGARALDGVDFAVRAGEVHALVGMNGAGKSTLIKVLSGALTPDSGRIDLDGQPVGRLTPHRARALGVCTVHQRRTLVGTLSVAENILLGRLPRRGPVVRWRQVADTARARLARLDLDLDVTVPAGDLSPAEQTMVEIAREAGGGRVLVLDEPTAALGPGEGREVHRLVRTLRASGMAVVYISHHLDEVLALADRITVLRDGRVALHTDADAVDLRGLVVAMTGDEVRDQRPERSEQPGRAVLELRGVGVRDRLHPLDLTVREREVVAVLGPAGDGQTRMFPVLSGVRAPDTGTVAVAGTPVPGGSIGGSLAAGLRCVTGDRLRDGLVPELGVDENVELARRALSRRGLTRWRGLRRWAAQTRARYGVRTIAADPDVHHLSGGNQQKVLLAKWFATDGRCYLLEEPTAGVDIAAKAEIYELVDRLVADGAAVLLASSDVDEVVRLADRIVVVRSGRVVAEHRVADVTRADLVSITVGGAA